MRLHRIFYHFNETLGDIVSIENDKAHYLRNVLRLKISAKLKIFNNSNQEFMAEIIQINKKAIDVKLIETIKPLPPSKLNITLVQSLSKGERMDYSIQKATELGVSTVLPIYSEYCEVKLKANRLDKKMNHWRNIATSASEQSFRADIPTILTPISIEEYSQEKRTGMLLEPEENKTIQYLAHNNWSKFDIAIGPEGGWSEKDLCYLNSSGLTGIQFGKRILRTETMAPAILAAIHSLWGDFV